MLDRIRQRSREESGFTLVELLVVMLILGILAAIAVPSFFAQRDKAKDADAKALVRTAQTAIETHATDNDGEYATATAAGLKTIESTLNNAGADGLTVTAGTDTYTVTVESDTENTFSISRAADGTTSQTCDGTAKPNAGCSGGTW